MYLNDDGVLGCNDLLLQAPCGDVDTRDDDALRHVNACMRPHRVSHLTKGTHGMRTEAVDDEQEAIVRLCHMATPAPKPQRSRLVRAIYFARL